MTRKELKKLCVGDIVYDNRHHWEGVEGKIKIIKENRIKFVVIQEGHTASYPKLDSEQSFEVEYFLENYEIKRKAKNNIRKL